jgi:GT2 family glycosyltransferase
MVGAVRSVSVVLPAYNAQATLRACLISLLANDHPDFEVVLVDDGSEDDTLKIVRELQRGAPRLRVLSAPHGGPARARNLGIREASGEDILFTDSDTLAPRGWMSGLCRELERRDAAAVGGGVLPLGPATPYSAAEQFRYHRLTGTRARFIGALPTCNLAVKREALEAVGLFDETFRHAASEDYDLCFRMNDLGYRIWFAPECAIHHRHPDSLSPILRRGFIQGREGARLARKRRGNPSNWTPGQPLHWLENSAVFSYWLLRHLPAVPSSYRWIIACFDLAFAIGWLSYSHKSTG